MAILIDLRGSEAHVDRRYPAAAFHADPGDEYVVVDNVALVLRVRTDGDKCRLTGRVQATLKLACSRCLELLDFPTDIAVDLLYVPHSANRGEGDTEIAEDALSTAFYHDDQIDLEQMVREQFQLALPMKPLCRDQCLGLCSGCGTNLNERRCTCDTRWRDPRLAALEALLSDRQRQ